jgi:peroxiredoxin
MNLYLKGGIVALIAAIAIWLWYQSQSPKLPVNQSPATFKIIDKMESEGMPDFALKRLDGTTLKLSDYKGKLVVVNFWASWCNPCVTEFPSMVKLIDRMKGQVQIIAVATDDDRKDVEAFTKAFGLPKPGFEVVWDEGKVVQKTYGVEKIPESFLVGSDFKLLRKVLGIEDWASDNAVEYFQSILSGGGIPLHHHK